MSNFKDKENSLQSKPLLTVIPSNCNECINLLMKLFISQKK